MLSQDRSKRGLKLSFVSSAIIIYILAGGTLGKDVSLFGTGITFQREWVLITAIILYYLYTYFRFTVGNPDIKLKFRRSTNQRLKSQYLKKGNELANEFFKKNKPKLVAEEPGKSIKKTFTKGQWYFDHNNNNGNIIFRKGFSFYTYGKMIDDNNSGSSSTFTFKINPFKWFIPYLKTCLYIIFNTDHFFKDILPIYLFNLALFLLGVELGIYLKSSI